MGTIIVIPPSIIMDQIFRKARPKPSKTDPLMKKVEEQQQKLEEGLKDEEDDTKFEDNENEDNEQADYTSSEIGEFDYKYSSIKFL